VKKRCGHSATNLIFQDGDQRSKERSLRTGSHTREVRIFGTLGSGVILLIGLTLGATLFFITALCLLGTLAVAFR
jgi:hypothetical protein